MSVSKFKLAIGIAIVAALASLVGVLVTAQRPAVAAATAATATPSPSPVAHPGHRGGPFAGGDFAFAGGTGTVTGINGSTITLRTLSGTLTVDTTSATTYSKEGHTIKLGDIKVDDVLQVRPVRGSALTTPAASPPATITAQSVTVVLPTFFGRVSAIAGPTIFIVTRDGQQAFVFTASGTTYESNGFTASFGDVKVGDYIAAEGTQTDLKHLTADRVVISTGAGPSGGPRGFGGPFRLGGPGGPGQPGIPT